MKKLFLTLPFLFTVISVSAAHNNLYQCSNPENTFSLSFKAYVDTKDGWNSSFPNSINFINNGSKNLLEQYQIYSTEAGFEKSNKSDNRLVLGADGTIIRKNFWRQLKNNGSFSLHISQKFNEDGVEDSKAVGELSISIIKPKLSFYKQAINCNVYYQP